MEALGRYLPELVVYDAAYRVVFNRKDLCKIPHSNSARIKFSHLRNLDRGKLTGSRRFTAWFSSLLDHVFNVVSLRSNEKMTGVNARRNVTFMANRFPWEKLSVVHSVADSMRVQVCSAATNSTVAVIYNPGGPKPASISLFNSTPEPLLKRFPMIKTRRHGRNSL